MSQFTLDADYVVPEASEGDRVDLDALNGHVLIVKPVKIETRKTKNGSPEAVSCQFVVDIDAADEQGQPGKIYVDALFFDGARVDPLRPALGRIVPVGVYVKTSGEGRAYPTFVEVPAEHKQRASAWLQQHGQRLAAAIAPKIDGQVAPAPAQAAPAQASNPFQAAAAAAPAQAAPVPKAAAPAAAPVAANPWDTTAVPQQVVAGETPNPFAGPPQY